MARTSLPERQNIFQEFSNIDRRSSRALVDGTCPASVKRRLAFERRLAHGRLEVQNAIDELELEIDKFAAANGIPRCQITPIARFYDHDAEALREVDHEGISRPVAPLMIKKGLAGAEGTEKQHPSRVRDASSSKSESPLAAVLTPLLPGNTDEGDEADDGEVEEIITLYRRSSPPTATMDSSDDLGIGALKISKHRRTSEDEVAKSPKPRFDSGVQMEEAGEDTEQVLPSPPVSLLSRSKTKPDYRPSPTCGSDSNFAFHFPTPPRESQFTFSSPHRTPSIFRPESSVLPQHAKRRQFAQESPATPEQTPPSSILSKYSLFPEETPYNAIPKSVVDFSSSPQVQSAQTARRVGPARMVDTSPSKATPHGFDRRRPRLLPISRPSMRASEHQIPRQRVRRSSPLTPFKPRVSSSGTVIERPLFGSVPVPHVADVDAQMTDAPALPADAALAADHHDGQPESSTPPDKKGKGRAGDIAPPRRSSLFARTFFGADSSADRGFGLVSHAADHTRAVVEGYGRDEDQRKGADAPATGGKRGVLGSLMDRARAVKRRKI